ncbi:MAG: hypothetical protein KDA84_04630, partial [Planctomycetaceae bacterium]|nr:hypothetical protein [Planctomycetaceae bacterium]
MVNSTQTDEQTSPADRAPQTRLRWFKVGVAVLLLGGVGTAGAYHFLDDKRTPPSPIAEYEQPDVGQVTKIVEAAETKIAKDQQTLHTLEKSLDEIQAEWKLARTAKEKAEAKVNSASEDELADASRRLKSAEDRMAELDKELEAAKAQRDVVLEQLKSDEQ